MFVNRIYRPVLEKDLLVGLVGKTGQDGSGFHDPYFVDCLQGRSRMPVSTSAGRTVPSGPNRAERRIRRPARSSVRSVTKGRISLLTDFPFFPV